MPKNTGDHGANTFGNQNKHWLNEKNYFLHPLYLQDLFSGFFDAKGYEKMNPVHIGSGIDDTTIFIGSHSSVLKKQVETKSVPQNGIYITQPCVRTQAVDPNKSKYLFNDFAHSRRGSTFTTLGITTPYSETHLDNITKHTLEFLVEEIRLDPRCIVLRVAKFDKDLYDCLHQSQLIKDYKIEIQTIMNKEEATAQRLTHRYGPDQHHIIGRNFNYARRPDGTDRTKGGDIGNTIVMYDKNTLVPQALEFGIGAETLLMELLELPHITHVSNISQFVKCKSTLHDKLRDCIMTSLLLLNDGYNENPEHALNIEGRTMKGKILRSYVHGLLYLSKSCYIRTEYLIENILKPYEIHNFGRIYGTEKIRIFIEELEKKLTSTKGLNKEELIIYNLLNID